MLDIERIRCPGWLSLNQAAEILGVSRQAVGQIAMRNGWRRGVLDHLVMVREIDVEMEVRTRLIALELRTRQLSGPRRRAPA